jgi:ABC-type multidrug transport system fused ATPase/permease subunit
VKRFLSLPIDTHSSIGSSEIQKTFERTANGQWEIANAIGNRLSIPITIFVFMTALGFYTNVFMTIVSLIPLPIGTWWLLKTGNRLSREQSESNNQWDKTLHRITDAFINIRIIKLFTRNSYESSIIKKKYDEAIE